MSIDSLLNELVTQVEGATGAIILEADGDAISWYPLVDSDRLRLRGAYVAVVLKGCRAAVSGADLGDTKNLLLKYDNSCFIVLEIDCDCFVMLELEASANMAKALFRMKPTVEKLRSEIAG